MIEGIVNEAYEAAVTLTLASPAGETREMGGYPAATAVMGRLPPSGVRHVGAVSWEVSRRCPGRLGRSS